LRAQRSNPCRSAKKEWIALARNLSSGAHSRDPVAPRNDGVSELVRCLKTESTNYLRRPGLEPGPIRRGLSVRAQALETFLNKERRGVCWGGRPPTASLCQNEVG
jgi:hypothetical protein